MSVWAWCVCGWGHSGHGTHTKLKGLLCGAGSLLHSSIGSRDQTQATSALLCSGHLHPVSDHLTGPPLSFLKLKFIYLLIHSFILGGMNHGAYMGVSEKLLGVLGSLLLLCALGIELMSGLAGSTPTLWTTHWPHQLGSFNGKTKNRQYKEDQAIEKSPWVNIFEKWKDGITALLSALSYSLLNWLQRVLRNFVAAWFIWDKVLCSPRWPRTPFTGKMILNS